MIKRQMFGRANFDLLRKRVLLAVALVSPTVDPRVRTAPRLFARWLAAGQPSLRCSDTG
jgi:hypothetical protein